MRILFLAGVVALAPAQVLAQAPDAGLGTPAGHELNVSVGGYRYVEPLARPISIHGFKVGAEYIGTASLGKSRDWFFQGNVRGLFGDTAYDGYCRPWLIVPNGASPNGYALGLGPAFACSESGDQDWYVESRALAGKDFVGRSWGVSPYSGVGIRHLSNGIGGVSDYRTDDYLYLALGLTMRRQVASRALSFTLEYDHLLRGRQKTRGSKLGGGVVPATDTAPAFIIHGFTDVSFTQHDGWALRASVKYQATRRWSLEPYYLYWSVGDSPVDYMAATFTVNDITVVQQLGFYEPSNTTDEYGLKLGVRF